MSTPTNNPLPSTSLFTSSDMNALFIRTLTIHYGMKVNIVSYIPWMVAQASTMRLRMNLMNTSGNIDTELFRLEVICKIMGLDCQQLSLPVKGTLNLQSRLQLELQGLNALQTDAVLLVHMVTLETLEANAFRLLIKLARSVANKPVLNLLQDNLKQSKKDSRLLADLMNSYLPSNLLTQVE